MIQVQVTRVVTLGTAAVTAALSTAVAQVQVNTAGASSSQPGRPALSSAPVAVVSGLQQQQVGGLVAVEQARQGVLLQPERGQVATPAVRGETAALAPPLVKNTPPPAASSSSTTTVAKPAAPAAAPAATSYPGGSIQDIIVRAFSPYGDGAVQWGLRVARCESGYNPRAVNAAGPYYGLFQFLMSTFKATPYGNQDIFDPVANASAAAWKFANGGASAWGCR